MSIGALLQILAYGVPQMIIGRIVAGIGNGINTSTAPPWQAETSKAAWRGKLIVIELILNIAGELTQEEDVLSDLSGARRLKRAYKTSVTTPRGGFRRCCRPARSYTPSPH